MKTRGINIIRTTTDEILTGKGEVKQEKRRHLFRVRVNSGITDDHKMIASEKRALLAYAMYKDEEKVNL